MNEAKHIVTPLNFTNWQIYKTALVQSRRFFFGGREEVISLLKGNSEIISQGIVLFGPDQIQELSTLNITAALNITCGVQ